VNPNTQALERWAESNGVTGEFATICEDPKAREFILGELTKMGKEKKVIRQKPKPSFSIYLEWFCSSQWPRQMIWCIVILLIHVQQLKGFELIRAVHLDPAPFDMERDLITPTYKKKRPQLLKHYQVWQQFQITRLGYRHRWSLTFVWMFLSLFVQSIIDGMYNSMK
jgi:long-chain acyl-CoA synthetase